MNQKVIIEISAHHCHISQKDLDLIYGKNYQLTPIKPLSQIGQFASRETINIKIGDKIIKNVRILGPVRKNTQIEISETEAHYLKIKPPIAECTCPKKSGGCVISEIIGPKGKINRCAIIIARRHLHIDPATAKKIGLKNKQLISATTMGKKSVTFHNILVRIDPNFRPSIHLDTDEGNAAGIKLNEKATIINNKY